MHARMSVSADGRTTTPSEWPALIADPVFVPGESHGIREFLDGSAPAATARAACPRATRAGPRRATSKIDRGTASDRAGRRLDRADFGVFPQDQLDAPRAMRSQPSWSPTTTLYYSVSQCPPPRLCLFMQIHCLTSSSSLQHHAPRSPGSSAASHQPPHSHRARRWSPRPVLTKLHCRQRSHQPSAA